MENEGRATSSTNVSIPKDALLVSLIKGCGLERKLCFERCKG